jgi:hypothetical protein
MNTDSQKQTGEGNAPREWKNPDTVNQRGDSYGIPAEGDCKLDMHSRKQVEALIRQYSVRDLLDYISDRMVAIAEEIGYEPDETVMRDDAAIVAHAANHIKS